MSRVENSSKRIGLICDDLPPLIPDGLYTAQCILTQIKSFKGGQRKAYLHFLIREGEHDGKTVFMACNYPIGRKSFGLKINKEFQVAMGRRRRKGERISLKSFEHRMYIVKMRSVHPQRDDGSLLPEFLRYSVVDHIERPLTGGC